MSSIKSSTTSRTSSSSSSSSSKSYNNKRVDFHSLTIREYPVILGDNPNVSGGAPLSLGWEYIEQPARNIDMYEYTRSERRTKRQMMIPVEQRGQLLLKMGYTIGDLATATMEIDTIKKSRSESMKSSNIMDRTKMVLETTGELPKGIMTGVAKLLLAPVKPKMNKAVARSA